MINTCHICNSNTVPFLNKDGYSLYKCSKCNLVYINPLPKPDFLKRDVYSKESGYQGNKAKDLTKTKPDKKTRDILNYLEKNNIKGNLLDVGCSNGEFMYHAYKRGFEVHGVELNSGTADIGIKHGLKIFKGILNDAKYEDKFFDVIFLGDVIEHVLSPKEFMKECDRILKPNGRVIISTPNLDCTWAKITIALDKVFKIPCSSVTPPYHTFQFSENNLDLLLSSLNFSKTSIWFYKPPRLMYELGSLHLLKRFKNNRNIPNLSFMIFAFAIYSLLYIMTVYTRFVRRNDFSMVAVYTKNE